MRLSLAGAAAAVSGARTAAAGTGLDLDDFTDAVLSKWCDICGQSSLLLLLTPFCIDLCAILRVQCSGMLSTVFIVRIVVAPWSQKDIFH